MKYFLFPIYPAPSGYPQNLAAITVNSTAIEVSWLPVLPEEQNGIITMYVINVFANTTFAFSMSNDSITLNDAVLIHLFTDLEEFVEYTFEISAFTVVGEGPISPNVSNTTDQAGMLYMYTLCRACMHTCIIHTYLYYS